MYIKEILTMKAVTIKEHLPYEATDKTIFLLNSLC